MPPHNSLGGTRAEKRLLTAGLGTTDQFFFITFSILLKQLSFWIRSRSVVHNWGDAAPLGTMKSSRGTANFRT